MAPGTRGNPSPTLDLGQRTKLDIIRLLHRWHSETLEQIHELPVLSQAVKYLGSLLPSRDSLMMPVDTRSGSLAQNNPSGSAQPQGDSNGPAQNHDDVDSPNPGDQTSPPDSAGFQ